MQPLRSNERPEHSERRQLTVMFCDLVGSTYLSSMLDPEDYAEILYAYHEMVTVAVEEYRGQVSQYLGDGLRVLFGYPRAHEDDPERAVRAGLAIIKRINSLKFRALRDNHPGNIKVRVGVATGIVIVGDVLGKGSSEDLAVFGGTPNLAARLQSIADPGTLVISKSTHHLVSNIFEIKNLGLKEAKGFTSEIEAWQVLSAHQSTNRFELVHGQTITKIENRLDELKLLEECFSKVLSSQGQVIFVTGDPGIGKSRVIMEFLARQQADTVDSYIFQCSPYHTQSSLYSVVSQFQENDNDDPQHKLLYQFESYLNTEHKDYLCIIAYLKNLLPLDIEEKYQHYLSDIQILKHDAFVALCSLLKDVSNDKTQLIILEDAHWLDPSSLELLSLIIESIQSSKVLLVVTARPSFDIHWLDKKHVTEFKMQALDPESSSRIIKSLTGHEKFSQDLIDQILIKADGQPLFIEELVKSTADLISNRTDEGIAEPGLSGISIPASLQDALNSRLDRLETPKECAQVGAVIGRRFSMDLMSKIMSRDVEEVMNNLQILVDEDIIYRDSDGDNYQFKHALVQDAAYQSLLKKNRRYLHSRVADVLEHQYPEKVKVEPELLAYYYTEADLPDMAIKYWLIAAGRALQNSAYSELITYVEKGLLLLHNLEDMESRDRFELDFQILAGAAYRATTGFSSNQVEQAFSRAYLLGEKLNENEKLIDILRGLFACYYVRAQLGTALQQADMVQAKAGDAVEVRMLGHWMRGCILFWQGDFLKAKDELHNAVELYDPHAQQSRILATQIDPWLNAKIHFIWTQWIIGEVDSAVITSEQVIKHARELQQPFTLSMALWWSCNLRINRGEFEIAEILSDELQEITREYNISYLNLTGKILQGVIMMERDRTDEGEIIINQAWDVLHKQEAFLGRPWSYANLISFYLRNKKYDDGLNLADGAVVSCERYGEYHWITEIYRLKGELLFLKSKENHEEAINYFEKAITIASNKGALSLELRIRLSMAKSMVNTNAHERSKLMLKKAYDRFTEGKDTRDLIEAQHLLANED